MVSCQPPQTESRSSDVECSKHRHGARLGSRHASGCTDGPLLNPQPKVREKKTRTPENSLLEKKNIFGIDISRADSASQRGRAQFDEGRRGKKLLNRFRDQKNSASTAVVLAGGRGCHVIPDLSYEQGRIWRKKHEDNW